MNIFNLGRGTTRPWPSRKPQLQSRSRFFSISLITLFLLLFLFVSYLSLSSFSLFSVSSKTLVSHSHRCTSHSLPQGEKFLFYAPHSGFSNQLSELKNAVLMSGILNRTLIVPPILDHHAIALGSCPKFRVSESKEIRFAVWNHVLELIRSGRYVSMADIVDISSLVASSIRVIDFRVFTSLWCGVTIGYSCSDKSNNQTALFDDLKQYGSLLSGLDGNLDNCLYAVNEDCRTTVWTYQNGENDELLDTFQPDEQLKKKKKISHVRRRRDVYKALGPSSKADSATVLAFGSLFTAPYKNSELYMDIHKAPSDRKIQSLIQKIEFLPFVPEIMNAGKEYAEKTIKAPYLCAQLRLLDGQFKNHWKATFLGLKQKIESLKEKLSEPIRIFVMTDLPEGNWTGSYLGDLADDLDRFKLYTLKNDNELVFQTAKRLMDAEHGLKYASVATNLVGLDELIRNCDSQKLPDILLYLEETVCSCAPLGFVGTAGSTIADSIELMRKFGACSAKF